MGKLKSVSFFQALLPHCYNRNRKYSKSNLNCNAIKNPQQTYLTCLEFHVIFFPSKVMCYSHRNYSIWTWIIQHLKETVL